MDETRWRVCEHPSPMLKLLVARGQRWHRKLRLAACAAVRRAWEHLPEPYRRLVETAERYADGAASARDVNTAWKRAPFPVGEEDRTVWACYAAQHAAALEISGRVGTCLGHACAAAAGGREGKGAELRAQAHLLREVVGPLPFRRVGADPRWRTRDVTATAEAIYRERSFADLPALADALEDAGCAEDEVLRHLRGPGPHALGCWALDLILEKE